VSRGIERGAGGLTLVQLDADGVGRIAAALRSGDPVVIPFPTPLPYAVAATAATTVNEAKGRPRGQFAGALLDRHDRGWTRHINLAPESLDLALWVGEVDMANLLLPVLPSAPDWMLNAAEKGFIGITLAWLEHTEGLGAEFGHLFVSSGNRTSDRPAVSTAEAEEVFGASMLILDGDTARDHTVQHGSATMLRVDSNGSLCLVRPGINDQSFDDQASTRWLK